MAHIKDHKTLRKQQDWIAEPDTQTNDKIRPKTNT